jgi:hypothetical protein
VLDISDDPVERQVAAYNNHDVEAFIGCYSESVVIEDGLNQVSMRGRAELRERYTAFFAAAPSLRVEIRSRIRVGCYVIDEEYVTGHPVGDVHAAAIFRLGVDGLIEHVCLLS